MDTEHIITLIAAVVGSLSGLTAIVISIFKLKPEKQKITAEAEETHASASHELVATALTMLEPYKKLVEDMEKDFQECKQKLFEMMREVGELKTANEALIKQNNSLNEQRGQLRVEINELRQAVETLSEQLKEK